MEKLLIQMKISHLLYFLSFLIFNSPSLSVDSKDEKATETFVRKGKYLKLLKENSLKILSKTKTTILLIVYLKM